MTLRRKPTYAMYLADEKRITKAREIMDAAWGAAMTGCPYHVPCETWLNGAADQRLVEAYHVAAKTHETTQQAAVDRGTVYRGTHGLLFRVAW